MFYGAHQTLLPQILRISPDFSTGLESELTLVKPQFQVKQFRMSEPPASPRVVRTFERIVKDARLRPLKSVAGCRFLLSRRPQQVQPLAAGAEPGQQWFRFGAGGARWEKRKRLELPGLVAVPRLKTELQRGVRESLQLQSSSPLVCAIVQTLSAAS